MYAEAQRTGDFVPVTEHYYSVMSTIVNEYFSGNFHFVAPLLLTTEDEKRNAETGGDEGEDMSNRDDEEPVGKYQSSGKIAQTKDDGNGGDGKNVEKVENGEDKTLIGEVGQLKSNTPIQQKPAKCLEESLKMLHGRIGKALRLSVGSKCVDIGCGIGTVMMDLAPTGAELTGLTVAQTDVRVLYIFAGKNKEHLSERAFEKKIKSRNRFFIFGILHNAEISY